MYMSSVWVKKFTNPPTSTLVQECQTQAWLDQHRHPQCEKVASSSSSSHTSELKQRSNLAFHDDCGIYSIFHNSLDFWAIYTFRCHLKEHIHMENTMNLHRVQVQGVKTLARFSARRDVCESMIQKNSNNLDFCWTIPSLSMVVESWFLFFNPRESFHVCIPMIHQMPGLK